MHEALKRCSGVRPLQCSTSCMEQEGRKSERDEKKKDWTGLDWTLHNEALQLR